MEAYARQRLGVVKRPNVRATQGIFYNPAARELRRAILDIFLIFFPEGTGDETSLSGFV
jgi:hypothetical protein